MTDQRPSGGEQPPSARGFEGASVPSNAHPSFFSPSFSSPESESPDPSGPGDAWHAGGGSDDAPVEPSGDAGAPGAETLAPRRRRRRGGRRHRRGSDGAPRDDRPDEPRAETPAFEREPDAAPDVTEAPAGESGAPFDADAPADRDSGRPRRRRGGRRRRRGGRGRELADAQTPNAPPRADDSSAPIARPELDDAFPPLDDVHEFVAVPNEPPHASDSTELLETPSRPECDARDGKSRRRRRGGRGRRRDRDERRDEVSNAPRSAELEPALDAAPVDSTVEAERAEAPSAPGDPRRRRRRGGRGRRRERVQDAGPVGVEVIPGEDDDIGVALEAPRAAPQHKKSQPDLDDDDAPRVRPGKRNVILVNASDREETRVAVVEDGQIVDFQMHVKRHENLVNDIYRGKVVNLEPAIGAAFVDFGQGRNGFLHTSDVLTVYGDKDWTLDKLLTYKVDPEEWDETSSHDGGGGDSSAQHAEHSEHAHEGGDENSSEGEQAPESDAQSGEGEAANTQDAEPSLESDGASEQEDREEEEREPGERPARGGRGPRRGRGHERSRGRPGGRGKAHIGRHRARPRLPITDLLEKGQSVVVQVTKDAIGEKGPTLTTYISIPGRYLVLMPSMQRTGVSRKIEDERERRRLKRILESLEVPAGMGVIVRTAGIGCTRQDLKRDLDYLMLLWADFGKRLNLGRGPVALYEESDVAIRTIRDLFNDHTEAVIVDDERVFQRVRDFVSKLMPENLDRIQLHQGPKPLFHAHNVEQDFERIFARRIDLPSGGSIVFDQAEALVAIDVNSGKTRTDSFDFEDVALRTNLDAVAEIARQIRLRDLGGIIVCDFIDMARSSGRKQVERSLSTALASDRARSKLGRISQFGLLELTRQRLGPGLSKMLFHNCPRCRGSGKIRTVESRAGSILRRLGAALALKGFSKVEVRAQPEVVEHLKRNYANEIRDLGVRNEREIELVPISDQIEDSVLRYLRTDGREVRPGGRRKR